MTDQLNAFIAALEGCDRKECFRLVRTWQEDGMCDAALYEHVLLPALAHIGSRWERNELGITTEHIATETIRQIIGYKAAARADAPQRDGTVIVGCVPNEYHDLAGMIVTNMLEAEGWRVQFYGQSVPHDDVVAHVARMQPGVVMLIMKQLQHLDGTIHLATDIRAKSPDTRVLVGGVESEQIRTALLPHVDGLVSTLQDALDSVESHMSAQA